MKYYYKTPDGAQHEVDEDDIDHGPSAANVDAHGTYYRIEYYKVLPVYAENGTIAGFMDTSQGNH